MLSKSVTQPFALVIPLKPLKKENKSDGQLFVESSIDDVNLLQTLTFLEGTSGRGVMMYLFVVAVVGRCV